MSDNDAAKNWSSRQPDASSATTATSKGAEDVSGDAAMAVEDPRNTATYRGLKAAVIIMGAMIVLAFSILVVGFVLKLSGHGMSDTSAAAGEPAHYMLPVGAKILSLQVTGDRLILGVHADSGSEVDIFDTNTGRLVGQIRPKTK